MSIILEAQNVVKRYAGHTALSGVSIQVPQGSIFGLLGPNGAGKTSLIRIINQITGPDEGQIILDGERLQPKHIEVIGYLPEERGLYKKMKVGEQLLYLAQLKGMPKAEAVEKLKAWFIKFDIKGWWDKNVEDLSKGMQQKTQFIATIVHEPKLVILDEPFSGFDPINANLLKDEILALKEKGTTIIFSTHRMESVEELCDNIALINKSKVVLSGEKKEVKNRFRDNTFNLEYSGALAPIEGVFEILSAKNVEGITKAKVRLLDGTNANQFLGQAIQQVDLKAFNENIPSFNEIFIKVVGEDANTIL
ncbi:MULTISPECIES: ABC transporter ATP-binding protein [Bacteroidota]|jgi:ABC-2 type transport system ATP-binding protein|uniref:ABC transporter ATP-binding protein n=1 Tax=Bacteroidota TaxID=976 RepID=UPI000BA3E239|nr:MULTISPECIES: ATP-binding cassette domain-containing protein [Bacteroidota]MDI9868058.1 ATP-binding cassette domain-containing protein [Flectobacillus roseus]NBA78463.1 ATP-binding cassette domain-containing protein [Emticicia sp. ODNR4P]NBB29209.1 ATP-binding cassette domain-containing protein [Cellulophaga sp. BC115SP]PAC27207.1 ABC transporter ATP-binding protein [Flectobacillus sp. BAB-3569]